MQTIKELKQFVKSLPFVEIGKDDITFHSEGINVIYPLARFTGFECKDLDIHKIYRIKLGYTTAEYSNIADSWDITNY